MLPNLSALRPCPNVGALLSDEPAAPPQPEPPQPEQGYKGYRDVIQPLSIEPSQTILQAAQAPYDQVEWVGTDDRFPRAPPNRFMTAYTLDQLNMQLTRIFEAVRAWEKMLHDDAGDDALIVRARAREVQAFTDMLRDDPPRSDSSTLLLLLATIAGYRSSDGTSRPNTAHWFVRRAFKEILGILIEFAEAGRLIWDPVAYYENTYDLADL